MTLLHELYDAAARRAPDEVAVTAGTERITFAELAALGRRIAAALCDAGLRRGDRLVVVAPPSVVLPAVLYAAARTGVVFVVLHEQVRGAPLRHVLDDCEPALVLSDDPDVRATAAAAGTAAADLSGLPGRAPAAGLPPGGEPLTVDPVCLVYTSGSTALPNAVVCTHDQVLFAVAAIQRELGYRRGDVVFCPSPASFDYGLYQLFLGALSGARVHLAGLAATGPGLLGRLAETGATVLPAVPSTAETLVRLVSRGGRPPALRLLTTTGAAMPADLLRALRQCVPGLRIQVMYGLTECKRVAIMPPDGDLDRPGSCGRPLAGTEVFTVDGRGRRQPAGTTGELVVRGPHVMSGYWRRPELTAERYRVEEGRVVQLRTGDQGRVAAGGWVYVDGRTDDIYKERGYRVSVTEVEAAARLIPLVSSAAVLPPRDGRRSVLVAVTALAPAEVLHRLREHLEVFKIPQRCAVVAGLPLTRNGKVDRAALTALVAGDA
ncbi:AMP-binding protein [Actinoplanes oblitus]|uniref:AMP-binding protein n=1 Tax=Actinoplanes oblitus TaxID=3040509 RepID=A0ABY8WRX4_9ACTN|nr:AMP-binding protein [Actinoplanes oblitus]WIM99843.1 AMP-binding protein [Actinoplanes oblitus]